VKNDATFENFVHEYVGFYVGNKGTLKSQPNRKAAYLLIHEFIFGTAYKRLKEAFQKKGLDSDQIVAFAGSVIEMNNPTYDKIVEFDRMFMEVVRTSEITPQQLHDFKDKFGIPPKFFLSETPAPLPDLDGPIILDNHFEP
jgi:hypothetical protein